MPRSRTLIVAVIIATGAHYAALGAGPGLAPSGARLGYSVNAHAGAGGPLNGFIRGSDASATAGFVAVVQGNGVELLPDGGMRIHAPGGHEPVEVEFVGAASAVSLKGVERQPGVFNDYRGSDPAAWRTDVVVYERVLLESLYPGIDLEYEIALDGRVKSTFHVAPGADPGAIQWTYGDTVTPVLEGSGSLRVDLPRRADARAELWREEAPQAWHMVRGKKRPVGAAYVIGPGGLVGFDLDSGISRFPLVIDPYLEFSTYLGGSSDEDEHVSMTADADGNVYVVGATYSADFPTVDPLQPRASPDEDRDAFITQLGPDGKVVFSTLIGGSGEDVANGVAVDESGALIVVGYSTSADFPLVDPLSGPSGEADWFVLRLDPAGRKLVFSTLLGGSESDSGASIAALPNGAVVVGRTSSPDFPRAPSVPGPPPSDDPGNAITVLDWSTQGASLRYSSFLPGGDQTRITSVAAASDNFVFVGGATRSETLPADAGFIPVRPQADSGFICGVPLDDPSATFCTYLGGSGSSSSVDDVAVGPAQEVWAAGYTGSSDFPVKNSYQPFPVNANAAFVVALSPAVDDMLYGTFLGGDGNDQAVSVDVDDSGTVYVLGLTSSADFPLHRAVQQRRRGPRDWFVSAIDRAGMLTFSTYLGGSGSVSHPHLISGAGELEVLDTGDVVVAGFTRSHDFPVVEPAQLRLAGGVDAFVARLNMVDVPTATALPATATSTPIVGSATATASPTVTSTLAPPTATVTPPSSHSACSLLAGRVPASVVAWSLANPHLVGGWGVACYPNRPPGPWNGLRSLLTLRDAGKPYHPIFNSVVFKCGCR